MVKKYIRYERLWTTSISAKKTRMKIKRTVYQRIALGRREWDESYGIRECPLGFDWTQLVIRALVTGSSLWGREQAYVID